MITERTTTLPCSSDGDLARANQLDALAGVLPLERRGQLAALLTDHAKRRDFRANVACSSYHSLLGASFLRHSR